MTTTAKLTLSQKIKAAAAKKDNHSGSEKNPAFYNRQKNRFTQGMLMHVNPIVRAAACADENAPTKQLQAALLIEKDPTVLRALLMNDNLPVKDITEFINDPRIELLGEDAELEAHVVARING